MSSAEQEGLSAYELERLDNIRRNEEQLVALGLSDGVAPTRHSAAATRRPVPTAKRPRATQPFELPTEGLRRSGRKRAATDKYTDDTPLPDPRRAYVRPRWEPYEGPDDAPAAVEEDDEEEPGEAATTVPTAAVERQPPEAGTSRAISIDTAAVIAAHLGEHIPGPPTKMSAVLAMTQGRNARFSKYSGSLEWRNAIVLWVNVGGPDYKNLFFVPPGEDGALHMTWYASPRNHEATPVVQRLIGSSRGGKDKIVLFCRLPGEPYVCCGHLEYVSHVPGRQPLKFVWRLVDHGKGKLEKGEAFAELMREAYTK